MLSVSMAASLTAPKVTWMCPSPLISASQLARDRREALLAGFFGRLVVAVDLDQAFANRAQRGVELGRVLVPALLEDLEAGRRRALPGPHQGIQPGLQAAELGLDLGVDVEETLGRRGLFRGPVLVLAAPLQPADAEPEAYVPSVSDLAQRLKARLQPSTHTPHIDRMSDGEYLRFLEDAIVTPPPGASTVVAVISAHAGTGTTTVTVLLATLFSTLRRAQGVAVDACPQSCELRHWLAPESRRAPG